MSLLESLKEMKEQAEELNNQGDNTEEEGSETQEEEGHADEQEPKAQEEGEKEAKPDAEDEKEPEDNAAWRRLRREAAAAKRLAEEKRELERQNEELRSKLTAPREEATQQENAAPVIDHEVEEIKYERKISRAETEFQTLEAKFRSTVPDYDGVSAEYANALARSIKVQNPRLSDQEIHQRTKLQILQKAGDFLAEGLDPIEELYHEAKELGFSGKSFIKEEEEKKEVKPDMRKVAANRARSAGTVASGGKSEAGMSRNYIAQNGISVAEWSKLSAAEKRSLMYGN